MNSNENIIIKKLEALMVKAAKDKAFRKRCLADANAALKEMNIELQNGKVIHFVEPSDKRQAVSENECYIELPSMEDAAVSAEELDSVAGGLNILGALKEAGGLGIGRFGRTIENIGTLSNNKSIESFGQTVQSWFK